MTAPGAAFIMKERIQCICDGIAMKKKLELILILLLIAAAGIGVFFLFYRQPADEAPEGLCVRIAGGEIQARCNGEALLPGMHSSGGASVETAADSSVRITYGDISVLLIEDEILSPASATVLIFDGSSVSREEIAAIWPSYAVITGQYSEETLRLLDSACKAVYRTDLQGAVMLTSDGTQVFFATEKAASSKDIFPYRQDVVFRALPTEAERACTYVINLNSKVFHLPSCPSVGQMKDSNRLLSDESREALLSAGYRPCGSCQP